MILYYSSRLLLVSFKKLFSFLVKKGRVENIQLLFKVQDKVKRIEIKSLTLIGLPVRVRHAR